MHNYTMTNREPFEYERWTAKQGVHSIYEILQTADGGVDEEILQTAEETAMDILRAADDEQGEIMVMIDSVVSGDDPHNLFVRDEKSRVYEAVRDNRVVYGYVEKIQCEQGSLPDSKLRLFAFISGINDDGTFSSYALNLADEGDKRLVGSQMVQVTEPSLVIDHVSTRTPDDMAEALRWRRFGRMIETWFDEKEGTMTGLDLMRKVHEEIIMHGLSLDEFTAAMNLLCNKEAQDHIRMDATLRAGHAYQFNPKGRVGKYGNMTSEYTREDTHPVVAFDFSITPDDNELIGHVYRDNRESGCLDQLDLDLPPDHVELRIRE